LFRSGNEKLIIMSRKIKNARLKLKGRDEMKKGNSISYSPLNLQS